MSEQEQAVETPAPVDVERALQRNYRVMFRLLAARLVIGAGLIALPIVVISGLGGPNTPWMFIPTLVGMYVLLFTAVRLRFSVRLVQCAKVLRSYPLEFWPIVDRKSSDRHMYGTVHTVRLRVPGAHGALWMWGMNAAGTRKWPTSAKTGVWFAGDVPFGGVLIVPGSNRLVFVSPLDWKKQARRRDQAGAERIALAHQANLSKDHWREPRMSGL